jgi:hypothetical protein
MAVTTFESITFPEEGIRGIKVAFTDDDGNAVVPNTDTIKWTLTDRPAELGAATTIINSREQVAISSASTIYITLEGNDLALQSDELLEGIVGRVLTVEYQYDSANLGSNVDDKAQYIFQIENMYYPT